MALRRRGIVTLGATMAVGALLSACGPDTPPDPSPTPVVVPTPSASTPTESAEERQQREDKEAAETAYRFSQAEIDRLFALGGASKPTPVLKAYTTGEYLDFQLSSLREARAQGLHAEGPSRTQVSANRGWSPTKIGLLACEDFSEVRFINRRGREVRRDRPKRFVQALTAEKVSGRWKIASGESKIVKSFERESGCEDI